MTVASFINGDIGYRLNQVDTGSNTGVSTALPITPGFACDGDRFSEFVYVQAGASFGTNGTAVIDGTVVTLDKNFTADLLTNASASGKIGQFCGAIRAANVIATGNGFWVQICGQANVAVAASTTGFTALNSSATAGTLTSTVSAGTNFQLGGIVTNATQGGAAGVQEATLNYPTIQKAN